MVFSLVFVSDKWIELVTFLLLEMNNVGDYSSVCCRDVFELMSQFVTAGSNNIVMLELDNPQ